MYLGLLSFDDSHENNGFLEDSLMIPIITLIITILLSNIMPMKVIKNARFSFRGKQYEINPSIYYILLLFPLYIIYTFQFSTSADYYNYSIMFNKISQGIHSIKEPAIYLLFKIISMLKLDFQFVYAVVYLITFTILCRILCQYSKDICLSLILFVCVFFALTLHQIRQLLAVMISFAAYSYIDQKKPFHFYVFILLASACHVSALIMLPAYFLLRYTFRLSDVIIGAGGCIFMGLGAQKILPVLISKLAPSRLNWYSNFKSVGILKWDLILLAIFTFIIIIYGKGIMETTINRVYINSFIVYTLLFFFCRWIPEIKRWGYYYFIPVITLIPNCLAMENNKKARMLYALLLFLYLCAYLLLVYKVQLSIYSLKFF